MKVNKYLFAIILICMLIVFAVFYLRGREEVRTVSEGTLVKRMGECLCPKHYI